MRITIINGSPKGKNSITSFTPLFIAKHFPQHTFNTIHAAQRINYFEKNPQKLKVLEDTDLIVWAYPVYTFLVPSQLHRIIELIKANGINLSGKWCTQVSTSKHVYDQTAHRFIEDNAADMGMRIVGGLSADMDDLLKKHGQDTAIKWWESVIFAIDNGIELPKESRAQMPTQASLPISLPTVNNSTDKAPTYDTLILTDAKQAEGNMYEMIRYFRAIYPHKTRVINIAEYPFKSGCIGCLRCATTTMCVFKDNFDTYLRTEILNADCIIYAFTIQDHSTGYAFKRYQDRNFCNGHRTTTMGKPIGMIVSGKLSVEENLKTYLQAFAQVGHNYISHIASDEFDAKLSIEHLAKMTDYALTKQMTLPQNFLGVGGHKIFRDLIYQMRGMMRADHKFYKEKGFYDDFPQKHWKISLFMRFVGYMMQKPKWNAKIQEAIVMPYQKLMEKTEQRKQ